MRSRLLSPSVVVLWFCLIVAAPRAAYAQWYVVAAFGGNYTANATVAVDQPSQETSLRFHDVRFAAKPFASPVYYDWRVGRWLGDGRRFAVELEFTHLKVISETARAYHVTGELDGVPIDEQAPMDAIVQRYSMTHGLNFVLANVVLRRPIGRGPFSLVLRGGAGATRPHAETTVLGQSREQYEWAGLGGHVAAGVNLRIGRRLSAQVEYRVTAARPRITLVDGVGRVTAVTQQIAAGLAFGFSR